MPQALTRGAQATRRPDHKLSPTVALHKWRPRINNVNAHLRQNQWPDFRVNTGEGSLILEAQVFKEAQVFQNQVFKTRSSKPWPLKSATGCSQMDSTPSQRPLRFSRSVKKRCVRFSRRLERLALSNACSFGMAACRAGAPARPVRFSRSSVESSCILLSSEVKQLLTSVLGELTVVRDGKFPLLSQ